MQLFKKIETRFLYLCVGLFLFSVAKAQTPPTVAVNPVIPGFLFDLKGEVLVNKYSKVTVGTPFFSDDWLKGKFISTDGKIYDNLSLKLDLVEQDIYFLNEQSQEMKLITPVSQIILTNFVTSQSFSFIKTDILCQSNPKIWFRVLDTGIACLLKSQTKQVIELKPYGSSVSEENIISNVNYFLFYNQVCYPIKTAWELWEKLNDLLPGFEEKTKVKVSGKKTEEELIRLTGLFNKKTR